MTEHPPIPSQGPWITDAEKQMVWDAVCNGWYDNMGMHLDQFSDALKEYTGRDYVLLTSSCTAALHLSMLALDLQEGDEVIVPHLTWVASASPILYCGATPVFCDVDPKSLCLSTESVKACITSKTKAIIAVGLAGNLPQMDAIEALAQEHGIAIVEDAAESIGATYKGRKAGSFGDISTYSFNGTKMVVAGQGGALLTDCPDTYEKAKLFAHHGINKTPGAKYFWSTQLGFNYNWSNLQAALALAQLRRIDELIAKKVEIFSWYKEFLGNHPKLTLNQDVEHLKQTYWLSYCFLDKDIDLSKEALVDQLSQQNIGTRPMFYLISDMPPFADFTPQGRGYTTPNAAALSKAGICLPTPSNLTFDMAKRVSDTLLDLIT